MSALHTFRAIRDRNSSRFSTSTADSLNRSTQNVIVLRVHRKSLRSVGNRGGPERYSQLGVMVGSGSIKLIDIFVFPAKRAASVRVIMKRSHDFRLLSTRIQFSKIGFSEASSGISTEPRLGQRRAHQRFHECQTS